MGRLFDMDNAFFRFMAKIADFVLLGWLVLLLALPIVTLGPAISAFYYVGLKEVRDEEGYVWRGFWKAFKENFKHGLLCELVTIVIGGVLAYDIYIVAQWMSKDSSIWITLLFFLIIGIVILFAATVIYLFPMIAKFANTTVSYFKNSLLMSVKHLPQTILLLFVNGLIIYYTIQFPLLVIFTVPLIGYCNSFILARVFNVYVPKKETAEKQDADFRVDVDESTISESVIGPNSEENMRKALEQTDNSKEESK